MCTGCQQNDNDNEGNKCINMLYDILTITISIADVTTDIIVLFSFYFQSRTTFFIISLVILIIAHMTYSIAFILRYGVLYEWGVWQGIAVFFLLLPFASIVSFIIYFTEDYDSKFSRWFEHETGLDIDNGFEYFWGKKERSKMAQWMMNKLSKHIGFIIEAAIESLPQSLLQITAIVYYKEANYVSIISIFLSMFSVMSKSLVFSQGIDIKTFIWSWLCIVVDFFGIFFTLTWVFYTNHTLLQPVFLGYFSIIGQLWFYKICITIIPIVAIGIMSWFVYWFWNFILLEIWNSYNSDSKCTKIFQTVLFAIIGTIFTLLISPIGFLALEIFCFSFLGWIMYIACTDRFRSYTQPQVNQMINGAINFISKSNICNKQDRMMRILAINYFTTQAIQEDVHYTKSNKLNAFIVKMEDGQVNALQNVSYADIRNNAENEYCQETVKIFPRIWDFIKNAAPECDEYCDCVTCHTYSNYDRSDKCNQILENIFEDVLLFWIIMIMTPIFFVGKLFQIVFPYIIIAYLFYHNHWNEIDLFQFVMLITYIGLQTILLLLGIMVCRIQWWSWHIQPGIENIYFKNPLNAANILQSANDWHLLRTSMPLIEKFILELYGEDIGKIIIDYYHSIQLKDDEDS